MSYDVLFVDDDQQYASDMATYIGEVLGIQTAWTTDPQEAHRLVREAGVKVVVLDQMMPLIDGVTLGGQLRERDRLIRRVLLSGEATTSQVASAYDRGFDRGVHKNAALDELPQTIRHALLEWRMSVSREARQNPILLTQTVRRGWFNRRIDKQIYLLSIDSIEEDFVPAGSWIEQTQVSAGEEVEETVEVEWSLSDSLQVSSTRANNFDLGLKPALLDELTTSIKTAISHSQTISNSATLSRRATSRRKLTLPAEPANPAEVHVKSRRLQVAPMYRRILSTLLTRCLSCGTEEQSKAELLVNNGRMAYRHLDLFSDGQERIFGPGSYTA